MSTISIDRLPPETRDHPPLVTVFDNCRGTSGMRLFIVTEAALFTMLFFAYFYLAQGGWRWPYEVPPKLTLALAMLMVLVASSAVLHWGEQQVKAARYASGRAALAVTMLMGLAFLTLQSFEYADHLKTLLPTTNVYGSIFYTITTFHAAHLIMGLLMLAYVLILPRLEPVDRPPFRPYHNAAMYWHFVDLIWLLVVLFLYIVPNTR